MTHSTSLLSKDKYNIKSKSRLLIISTKTKSRKASIANRLFSKKSLFLLILVAIYMVLALQ